MKVLVLGCGNIGSAAAEDLAKNMKSTEIIVADKSESRAKTVAEKIGESNLSWIQLDSTNQAQLNKAIKDSDIVLGFLPGTLGYQLMESCIEERKDLVDVSFMAENPLKLNTNAIKAEVTIVPDCGFAPGISNILVGHAVGRLDKVQTVHIMAGGLPEKPIPPLGYVITWSPESLIDEYMRKARIVKNGRIVDVEALSGLEEVEFPNVGKLEAFFTDGLRTLLHTIEDADEMWEKTLRYSGHAEKVKLLRNLGFFEDRKIDVEDSSVSPRKLTAKLLQEKLSKSEIGDIVALKVEVLGIKNGRRMRHAYHLHDKFDRERKITAMARTTAYPTSIVAQMILSGTIQEKGVVPPEKIGMNETAFKSFLNELKRREIQVSEEQQFLD